MSRPGDETFTRGDHVWRRRWAVASGEHANGGRYVWEAGRFCVWAEKRWFEMLKGVRGDMKIAQAVYHAAIDRVRLDGEWPTLLFAMDAVLEKHRRAA